jgi:hypothetical protein
MRLKMTNIRSAKAINALLTIVSLEDSLIWVKRFYERGVLKKSREWGGVYVDDRLTLSLCGRLRFRS